VVLTLVGLAATYLVLYDLTQWLYDMHFIDHHSGMVPGSLIIPY
jgi:NhaB family Na+:H+ antiporter